MSMLVSMLSRLSSSVELCRAVDTLGYVELSIDTLAVLTYLDTTERPSRAGGFYVEAVSRLSSLMSSYVEVCRGCRLDIHLDTDVEVCRGMSSMSTVCRQYVEVCRDRAQTLWRAS